MGTWGAAIFSDGNASDLRHATSGYAAALSRLCP
jgi:hypothetical protein